VADKHRKISVEFTGEERGGAVMETALLLGLAAFFAFTMKHLVATPLLAKFTRASQVLSEALGG